MKTGIVIFGYDVMGQGKVFASSCALSDGEIWVAIKQIVDGHEGLGFNWKDQRVKIERFPRVNLTLLARDRHNTERAREMTCLRLADVQAYLDGIKEAKITDIAKKHRYMQFKVKFCDAVRHYFAAPESEAIQPTPEIRIDSELSPADQFRADLSKLVLQGRLRPEVVDLAATTNYPVVVRVTHPKLPAHLTPDSPFYAGAMRRVARGPEIAAVHGPKVAKVEFGVEDIPNYRPNVFHYERGDLFRNDHKTLKELAQDQPDHPLVQRQEIDMFRWMNVEVDGKLERRPNPNYGKPVKPYWE